ncbi:MAG: hypothetical protein JWL84_1349 [Rhodospirillales bacterium]|nr:hypothetical protein [Rhodospirillales bacterium]
MRPFIVACLTAAVIAVGAAVFLNLFLQESAETAFTEPSARI